METKTIIILLLLSALAWHVVKQPQPPILPYRQGYGDGQACPPRHGYYADHIDQLSQYGKEAAWLAERASMLFQEIRQTWQTWFPRPTQARPRPPMTPQPRVVPPLLLPPVSESSSSMLPPRLHIPHLQEP